MSMLLLLFCLFFFGRTLHREKKVHNVYLKRFQRIYLLEDLFFNIIILFYKHFTAFTDFLPLLQIYSHLSQISSSFYFTPPSPIPRNVSILRFMSHG